MQAISPDWRRAPRNATDKVFLAMQRVLGLAAAAENWWRNLPAFGNFLVCEIPEKT